MKKGLSPLEELRNKIRQEDTEETFKRKGLIRNPPTDQEIKVFIDNVAAKAFEQIKEELSPYFKKIRIRKFRLGAAFYVTEPSSNMYSCRVDLTPKRGLLSFSSRYAYHSERYNGKLGMSLESDSSHFSSLNEITAEKIIAFFNKSFFQRIQKMEESIKESESGIGFDGDKNY